MLKIVFLIGLIQLVYINCADQILYGQCGGIGYNGPTKCPASSTCIKKGEYYSQCLPGGGGSQTTGGSRTTGGSQTTGIYK